MALELPKISYQNILNVCAIFSAGVTTNEVLFKKCGAESFAILPAFTAASLCGTKAVYDYGFNTKAFIFGATTAMAYAISDIYKDCGYFSKGPGVNNILLGLSIGMCAALVTGGLCHGAYRLAERMDGKSDAAAVGRGVQ